MEINTPDPVVVPVIVFDFVLSSGATQSEQVRDDLGETVEVDEDAWRFTFPKGRETVIIYKKYVAAVRQFTSSVTLITPPVIPAPKQMIVPPMRPE